MVRRRLKRADGQRVRHGEKALVIRHHGWVEVGEVVEDHECREEHHASEE